MKFRMKAIAFSVIICLAAVGAVSAQSSAGNMDSRVVALDFGMSTGFALNGNALIGGRAFGLGVTVSDNLAFGIVDITANANQYVATRLSYGLMPVLGFDLYVGTNTANAGSTAVGAGVYYNAFKSSSSNGLVTGLKVRLEYFFDTTGLFQHGDLVFTVGSTFGL